MLDVKFEVNWNYHGQRGKEILFHTAIGSFMTAMRDWAPAFQAIIDEVLEPAVDEQFSTMGHGEWAELAPATVKRKGSSVVLITQGQLSDSFTRSGANHVEEVTRASLKWGSSIPWALFHQTGTGSGFQMREKGPGRGLPMRKIIELSSQNKNKMRSILTARLATIARKEGFAVTSGQVGIDPIIARMAGAKWLGM